jgi:hypothetical protein
MGKREDGRAKGKGKMKETWLQFIFQEGDAVDAGEEEDSGFAGRCVGSGICLVDLRWHMHQCQIPTS